MEKQLIPKSILDELEALPIRLPDFEMDSPPFSRGLRPEEYTLGGLKKVSAASTARTDAFRKYVLAIEEIIGAPVPYVFRTVDGAIRSLDAGCLGYCINRSEPYFKPLINERGFIEAIESTPACNAYLPLIPKLVDELQVP